MNQVEHVMYTLLGDLQILVGFLKPGDSKVRKETQISVDLDQSIVHVARVDTCCTCQWSFTEY